MEFRNIFFSLDKIYWPAFASVKINKIVFKKSNKKKKNKMKGKNLKKSKKESY